MFTSIATGEDLSSNLVGLDIYNASQQKIGTVKDIAMSDGRVNAYIVGVGGFLGIGDHYVAVKPSAITITFGAADKKWRATMDTNAAALKAAPEYKYAS
jgi:sporulation protein YlmC with PRC-barrel domain